MLRRQVGEIGRFDHGDARKFLHPRRRDVFPRLPTVARDLLPQFLDAVNAVLRRHLVLVAYQMWSTDEDVAAVTRRLLAKSPEDRYQTPAELVDALADFTTVLLPSWS